MLFRRPVLEAIARGEISEAYRYWRRPTVATGGTLMTERGQLRVLSVEAIAIGDIGPRDARAAGYPSLDALREDLVPRPGSSLYRIRFAIEGPDPRVSLRECDRISGLEADALWGTLRRMDARSKVGPWTEKVLSAISRHPGSRAIDLAGRCGLEKEWLKRHVRQLKNLGLTESLNPGYRLSKRGEALLRLPRA